MAPRRSSRWRTFRIHLPLRITPEFAGRSSWGNVCDNTPRGTCNPGNSDVAIFNVFHTCTSDYKPQAQPYECHEAITPFNSNQCWWLPSYTGHKAYTQNNFSSGLDEPNLRFSNPEIIFCAGNIRRLHMKTKMNSKMRIKGIFGVANLQYLYFTCWFPYCLNYCESKKHLQA